MKVVTIYPESRAHFAGIIQDLYREGMAFKTRTSLTPPFFAIHIFGKRRGARAPKVLS